MSTTPSAADLPDGSVVATAHKVWIRALSNEFPAQWPATDGRCYSNRQVDEALATGATVLRRGTGEG